MRKPKKTMLEKDGPTLESVHQSALKLSHDERVELIDLLSISLDWKKLDAVDAAWAKEIKRRLAEINAGGAKFVSWEEVKAKARERWKNHD